MIARTIMLYGVPPELPVEECVRSFEAATTFRVTNVGLFNNKDLAEYYSDLVANYPLVTIEDPLDEEDWSGWRSLKNRRALVVTINVPTRMTPIISELLVEHSDGRSVKLFVEVPIYEQTR